MPVHSEYHPVEKYPFHDMVVGDYFSAVNPNSALLHRMAAAARAHAKKYGGKFSQRKQKDGSIRLVRVE